MDKQCLSEPDVSTKFITPALRSMDALMARCERMEAVLIPADTTRMRLLKTLLHDALESAAQDASNAITVE